MISTTSCFISERGGIKKRAQKGRAEQRDTRENSCLARGNRPREAFFSGSLGKINCPVKRAKVC